jgi:multidrug efflux pump subunit AcrA (membrane-fusion protein)
MSVMDLHPMIQPRTAIVGGLALLSLAGSIALASGRGAERAKELSSPALPPHASHPAEAGPIPSAAAHRFLGVILARSSVDVAARFEGRLRAVHVRLGDSVPSGGTIASLDVPSLRYDLDMAEATVKTALVEQERAVVELAEAEERFARRKSLSAEALASGEDLSTARYQHKLAETRLSAVRAQLAEKRSQVEKLRQSNADAEIRAPFDGIVAARYVDPGANVTPATPIVRLISARGRDRGPRQRRRRPRLAPRQHREGRAGDRRRVPDGDRRSPTGQARCRGSRALG